MPYIHKIFEKATIRSIADYLLFGLGPDEDTRDYEERLDELYNKFEGASCEISVADFPWRAEEILQALVS